MPVEELNQKMICAEHREATRIPNTINSGKAKLDGNYPDTYRLGAGHVKFYYPRLKWLHNRYNELHNECLKRGYNVIYKWPDNVPEKLYNDWNPSYDEFQEALKINRQRISDRLSGK